MEAPLLFWSRFLGLTPEALLTPAVSVVPHAELAGYHGAWIFDYGTARVVSVPEALVDELRMPAAALERAMDASQAAQALFGDRIERLIGPAYHGCLAPDAFRPYAPPGVRELTKVDAPAVARLRGACSNTAWRYAGIDEARDAPRFGVWLDGCLASIAQNDAPAPGATSPGVVTHPYFRGRGCGKAAVSAAVTHALERGELVLYQTLLSNKPALAVAAALGFQDFGTHVAVRFRQPAGGEG
ncbi:MAG: GNAT family N-acetyltransferase [Actinomycetota bacterium]